MIAERDGSRVVLRVDGKLPERVDPDDGATVRRALKKLAATEADFAAAMLALEPVAAPPSAFVVEAWDEGGDVVRVERPTPLEALVAALALGREHHRWHGRSQLCCLDVDRRPGFPEPDAAAALRSIGPQPALWWRSRRGGLHFLFVSDEPGTGYGLTAEQKAGAFALCAASLRTASVVRLELLASTRAGDPQSTSLRYGVGDLAGALRGDGGADAVAPEAVAAWLEERGLEVGGRYSHERCPIDPGPSSGREPVVVTDAGVHCFRCAGVTGRGTVAWARLIRAEGPTAAPDPIVLAASHRVHWQHASLLLAALAPQLLPPVARAAYAALLTLFDAEAAPAALAWSGDMPIVRSEGGWIYWPSGRVAPITVTSTRTLPWARNAVAVEAAARSPDECLPGYTPVRPTRCLVDRPEARDGVVLVPLVRKDDAKLEPPVADAYDALAELQDAIGLSLEATRAVQLLVLLGMRAQLVPATPGFLLIDGPSGSGKAFVTALAGGVLGCDPEPVDLDGDSAELARSMGTAVTSGASLLWLDEVGKMGSMWAKSAPLLRLGSRISWRELHVGHVSAAMTAGLVLTGSTLPHGLTTMTEFQRRMVRVALPDARPESAEWPKRLERWLGVADGSRVLTTTAGRRWAEALRRWARSEPLRPWVEHALELGALRLEDEDEAVAQQRVVEALYRIWSSGAGRTGRGDRLVGWLKCHEGEAATIVADWWAAETDDQRRALCGRLSTTRSASGARCTARHAGARIWIKFDE